MKKLLLFFITLVLSVSIYAQTSPVGLSRIASATTAFGSPLPFGWKVFDGNTKLTYTVIEATGVAGTATLTSASSSFQLDTPDLSVYELLSNKQSNLTASTTKYPTVNAVNTGLGLKQDALGFTPYNATNPNGYTSNTGTVTSIATGYGITGGTITSTGTLIADSSVLLSKVRAGHDYQVKGTYSTDIHSNITALNAVSGTNTGDNATNTQYSGLVSNATHTGDVTGSTALTLATVNSNIGTYNNITINAKGLATAGSNVSYEPAFSKNTAFNKNFGTATTQVWGYDSHPTTVSGYGITDIASSIGLSGYLPLSAGSGNALTGTLYGTSAVFSGSVTLGNANNSYILNSAGGGTGYVAMALSNTGGSLQMGIAGSSGSFWGGTEPVYYSTIGTATNTALGFATNGTLRVLISNSGNATFSGSVTATGATFTTGAGSGKVCTSDGSGVGSWAALGGAAYKGQIDGSTGSGLADGTGTTGWYYACSTAGTHNYGSGNITLAIGDQLYYNGSIWLKIPGAGSYTLPTASSSVLGGVKSGSVVTVDGSGVLGFSNPGYISGNQTITLGGILSGSGTTSISASAASGYYMPTTTDQTNWNAKTSYNDLPYSQKFTEAATGSTGQVNTLDHTPKGGKVLSVAQNGSILDPANYTVSGATVQVTVPVFQYDTTIITFLY